MLVTWQEQFLRSSQKSNTLWLFHYVIVASELFTIVSKKTYSSSPFFINCILTVLRNRTFILDFHRIYTLLFVEFGRVSMFCPCWVFFWAFFSIGKISMWGSKTTGKHSLCLQISVVDIHQYAHFLCEVISLRMDSIWEVSFDTHFLWNVV